jgi:hypothetical protein
MNIVRLMVFFVLGLLLGVLLPSLVTWELSPNLGDLPPTETVGISQGSTARASR